MIPRHAILLLAGLLAGPATGAAADTNTGRLTGFVRLAGPPPALSNHVVTVDLTVCGNQARPLHSLLLGTNQAVRDAVVWLDAPATPLGPPTPAALDQRQCDFVPRVQLARAGAPLLLRNSDPTLHVAAFTTNGPPAWWTVAAPYAGFVATNQLPATPTPLWLRAGNRNGHDWMTAFIVVLPHPWGQVTGARGDFYLRAIPAGPHTVRAWHEVLGVVSLPVTIRAGATTTVNLEFTRRP